MGNERTVGLMEKIVVSRAKHYWCPNCGKTYKKSGVWVKGWGSNWCGLCCRDKERIGDCKLEVKE